MRVSHIKKKKNPLPTPTNDSFIAFLRQRLETQKENDSTRLSVLILNLQEVLLQLTQKRWNHEVQEAKHFKSRFF